jgi:hypothetical protein
MTLWNTLTNFLKPAQQQYIDQPIPADRVDRPVGTTAASAEAHYFRFKVAQMFLRDKAKLLQTWYPAVNSVIQCSFGTNTIELPNVADTTRLLAQTTASGDIIARNFLLAPLLPFKGGAVGLAAGLFAVKGENQMKDFIGVMSGFAKLLAVPQISSALNVAGPLADGVQALVGGGGLHLGYHNSYVGTGGNGNLLAPGYFAVVRSTDQKLRPRLLVVNDELWEGTSLTDPQRRPYTAEDFILLHLEVRETRDDFNELTSIANPYDDAIKALGDRELERADSKIRLALTNALTADELTKADRRRVVDTLKADYELAKETLAAQGLVDVDEHDLQQQMNSAARAVTAQRALDIGEPTWRDVSNVTAVTN